MTPDMLAASAEQPSALAIRTAISGRQTSAEAVALVAIERISEREQVLHAWKHFDPAAVLVQARALDRALATGAQPGLLAAVPLAVMDTWTRETCPPAMAPAPMPGTGRTMMLWSSPRRARPAPLSWARP